MNVYQNQLDTYGEITEDRMIVCPYCFDVDEDILFDSPNLCQDGLKKDLVCRKCGETFSISVEITCDITTKRKEP